MRSFGIVKLCALGRVNSVGQYFHTTYLVERRAGILAKPEGHTAARNSLTGWINGKGSVVLNTTDPFYKSIKLISHRLIRDKFFIVYVINTLIFIILRHRER